MITTKEKPVLVEEKFPEKPLEGYEERVLKALEAKRDTLEAFFAMSAFRKGKKAEEMTSQEIEEYEALRKAWEEKKEISREIAEALPEEMREQIASLGSSLGLVREQTQFLQRHLESSEPAPETPGAESDLTPSPKSPAEGITLEEIEKGIEHAKITGRVPGVTPEGLAYWEQMKRELLERRGEEEKGKNAEEIRKQLGIKRGELAEANRGVEEMEKRSYITGVTGGAYDKERKKTLEKEIKLLEKELDKLESGWGKTFKDRAKSVFDKFKKKAEKETGEIATEKSKKRTEAVPALPEGTGKAETSPETINAVQSKERRRGTVWGWIKERVKSFGPFGEIRQAELLRKGTGFVANDIEAYAPLVKQEQNLDMEQAQEMAEKMKKRAQAEGASISDPKLEKNGQSLAVIEDRLRGEVLKFDEAKKLRDQRDILLAERNNILAKNAFIAIIGSMTKEIKDQNDDQINYTIRTIMENIKESLKLKKARGQATAENVLTPEALSAIESDLRTELNKLRDGATIKDVENFRKLLRSNLDKYWWFRYVYAGAELAGIYALGYYWSGKETITLPNVERPAMFMPDSYLPPEVTGETRTMLHHYWGVTKGLFSEFGVTNPTDAQIMEVTKVLAKDNGVAVKIWNIAGSRLDTMLPVHQVHVGGALNFIRKALPLIHR